MSSFEHCAGVLDGYLEKPGSSFVLARDQVREAEAPFRVLLVSPPGYGTGDDVVHDVMRLLARYGIDPAFEHGARQGGTLLPEYDDAEILVIFALDGETRALCLAMASKPVPDRAVVACVPAGPEDEYLRRLLAQEHKAGLVSLPASGGGERVPDRTGIHVVRACANALVAWNSARIRRLNPDETVVLMLHGIRTRAQWMSHVKPAIEQAGLIPVPTNYGMMNLLPFALRFRDREREAIGVIRRQIQRARERYGHASFAVLAHSYGSYVVGRLLAEGETFDRVILCGSILPSEYDFAAGGPPVLNDVGSLDVWPVLASKVSPAYGHSGSFGFHSGVTVEDRFHPGTDHGQFLTREFAERFWVPFLADEKVERASDGCCPSRRQSLLDWLPHVWSRTGKVVYPLIAVLTLGILGTVSFLAWRLFWAWWQ